MATTYDVNQGVIMIIDCPECQHQFRVSVTSVSGTKPTSSSSPITGPALRSVLEFMKHVGPRRATTAKFYMEFRQWDDPRALGGRGMTKNAFSRALRRNGAQPWRTPTERGYEIPALDDSATAARPARTVREAAERASYERSLVEHGRSRPVEVPDAAPVKPAGLPDSVTKIFAGARERDEAQRRADLARLHGTDDLPSWE